MSFAAIRRWLLAALPLAAVPALSGAAVAQTDLANAERAYGEFVQRFWDGSPAAGHLIGKPGEVERVPKGYLWGYAHGINVFYSWWKFGPPDGRADAAARIGGVWHWIRTNWTLADVGTCGVGTTYTAMDDATWSAQGLLEIAEVTGDKTALAYARATLDCAWTRWHDDALGGGLWYSDARHGKSNYQASYALATYIYFQMTGDTVYRDRAVGLENWAAAVLLRNGQVVAGHQYPKDGLYWMSVDAAGMPAGFTHQYTITMTASCAMIEAQMAFAVLQARLFAATGNPDYRQRAQMSTEAIAHYELVRGTNIYLNDRDAFVDGFAAAMFAHDVVKAPNLLTPEQVAEHTGYLQATARSILQNDRGGVGMYGGDWQGPFEGVWAHRGSRGEKLLVTAQAINLAIAGYVVSH
jgi:hypothetical protein